MATLVLYMGNFMSSSSYTVNNHNKHIFSYIVYKYHSKGEKILYSFGTICDIGPQFWVLHVCHGSFHSLKLSLFNISNPVAPLSSAFLHSPHLLFHPFSPVQDQGNQST